MKLEFQEVINNRLVVMLELALDELGGLRPGMASVSATRMLKAAIQAGWIVNPKAIHAKTDTGESVYQLDGESVDEMSPAKVRKLGLDVSAVYTDAVTDDPN